ncbi:MAG: hypothetical protein ACFE0Q_13050 [Anaerolineae bacterium]
MMRRFFLVMLIALLSVSASVVMAQDSTDEIVTIEIPDVLIICPGESIVPTVRDLASLLVEFRDADDAVVIPVGMIGETNGVTTITIGRVRLNCDSTVEAFAQLNPSPSVGINETAPRPQNLPGIAEAQSGYLIVNTSNANLRSCDEPTCTRVGIVSGGDYLIALGTNGASDDRLWWYVQVGDINGWIWGDLVIGRGDLTDVPVVATAGEVTPPTVYIGYTGNLIYDVLAQGSQAICAVQSADNYPLLGRNADTSWVWIEAQCIDGTVVQGWMNADNVAIRNTGEVFVPVLGPEGLANAQ